MLNKIGSGDWTGTLHADEKFGSGVRWEYFRPREVVGFRIDVLPLAPTCRLIEVKAQVEVAEPLHRWQAPLFQADWNRQWPPG